MKAGPLEIRDRFRAGEIDKHQYSAAMHASHRLLQDYAELLRGSHLDHIEITPDQVILVTRDHLRFCFDPADHYVPPTQLLNFGEYEPLERAWLHRLMKPGHCLFDIGANIGWYTLLLARQFPDSQVLAFEPLPTTFQKLQRNLALNDLPNVTLYNFGFSDQDREETFYFSPEISGAASGADILGRDTVQKITCRVRRLDQVRRELGRRVDFIKCDVEGAELLVLQGAPECLAQDRPLILCEMLRKWSAKFHYHPNDIIALLATAGYQCFAIAGTRLERLLRMEETTEATNFLFFHVEEHHSLLQQLAQEEKL
jgi:FkbM family methyltransferase